MLIYHIDFGATAAYLRNRSPTKAVNEMTPYEAWTGGKPQVDHLRIFGCQAFVHIPKDERKKLDSNQRNVFSWIMEPLQKAIDCMIHLSER